MSTHSCPIEGCPKTVRDEYLMCGRHWRLVSPPLQSQLYRAWDRGRGAGTDAHGEAMRLCIDEVEAKLQGAST